MDDSTINIPLLQLAGGLLAPTGSRSFGASLSNGLMAYAPALANERQTKKQDELRQFQLDTFRSEQKRKEAKDIAAMAAAKQQQETLSRIFGGGATGGISAPVDAGPASQAGPIDADPASIAAPNYSSLLPEDVAASPDVASLSTRPQGLASVLGKQNGSQGLASVLAPQQQPASPIMSAAKTPAGNASPIMRAAQPFNWQDAARQVAALGDEKLLGELVKIMDQQKPIKGAKGERIYSADGRELIATNDYVSPEDQASVDRKTAENANELMIKDANGRFVPNAPLAGMKAKIGAASATKIDNRQLAENAYSKGMGDKMSSMHIGIMEAAAQAPQTIASYEQLGGLLEGLDGGALENWKTKGLSVLQSAGIDIDPRLGDKQAAEAIAVKMASNMRKPGTGTETDRDFVRFMAQVPDLSKSKEGRKIISDVAIASAKRDQEVARMANAYVRQNGQLDGGFMEIASQYMAANPVVPKDVPKRAAGSVNEVAKPAPKTPDATNELARPKSGASADEWAIFYQRKALGVK